MRPIILDLYCGVGGWAPGFLRLGFTVIGVDLVDYSAVYPGFFVQADLLTWRGWESLYGRVKLVIASPPCEEFSRHSMPWTRSKNPPEPNLAHIQRCSVIASCLGVPLVLENVRAAQNWLGRSAANSGPFHFWGSVPACVPELKAGKEKLSGNQRHLRAKIPFELSYFFAWANRQHS